MIDIDLDAGELLRALGEADRKIGQQVGRGLELGADLVAAHAKQHHDYEDRSSLLTNSIESEGVTGSWRGDDLVAAVAAGAPHATAIEYGARPHVIRPRHRRRLRWPVEGGYAFATKVDHPGNREYAYLGNALDAKLPDIVRQLEAAIELGFHRAGL